MQSKVDSVEMLVAALCNFSVEVKSSKFPNILLQVIEIYRVKVTAGRCLLFIASAWELTFETEWLKSLILFYIFKEPTKIDQLWEITYQNVF